MCSTLLSDPPLTSRSCGPTLICAALDASGPRGRQILYLQLLVSSSKGSPYSRLEVKNDTSPNKYFYALVYGTYTGTLRTNTANPLKACANPKGPSRHLEEAASSSKLHWRPSPFIALSGIAPGLHQKPRDCVKILLGCSWRPSKAYNFRNPLSL